uniref:NADH-ubiquinone oxidoreductase chain 2 n=1 Tax=Vespa mandarinia TaxID=7446 RepID=A0A7G1HFC7_VESMA|nr:NADH dehydrogenase subunit 2 [Vespa mandarinia]WHL55440.1 NADH dehydrogenase subunit 2 [Vespa mandarinia]BCD56256.1 NADH dehydrogenase subunit 2 [Vespa mandarinia]BCD56269.1 NADH dehydrogenase subunit 2 [Vespa mandarinia]
MLFSMSMVSVLSMFFSNFIHLWVLMEINTLLMISMMSIYTKSYKSVMNFFAIQSFSSLILIYLLMVKNNIDSTNPTYTSINFMLTLSFSLKLGLFPFFFWPPLINKNISWTMLLMMSTSQKFVPLLIFNMFIDQFTNNQIMFSIIFISILSSSISTIMNSYETNLKKIMTLSSTNHLSWMLMVIMFDSNMFLIYFITYTLSMIFLCSIFNKLNIIFIHSLSKIQLFNFKMINFFIILNLLIISGLPPFFTFIMKINILKIMIEGNAYLASFLLMAMSTFTLIFYLNIIMKMNTLNLLKIKFYKFNMFDMKFNFMSILYISILTLMLAFFALFIYP